MGGFYLFWVLSTRALFYLHPPHSPLAYRSSSEEEEGGRGVGGGGREGGKGGRGKGGRESCVFDGYEVYIFPLAICSFFMVGETIVQYTARLPVISILGRLLQKLLAYQQHAQFTVAYLFGLSFPFYPPPPFFFFI